MNRYLINLLIICIPAVLVPERSAAQDASDTLCWKFQTAAWEGDSSTLLMLLSDSTLDIDCFFDGETNALGYAVQQGHYPVAELLLQYGANPNGHPEISHTPLSLAAGTGNLEIAELLILYGASPDLADRFSLTPLLRAVYYNDFLMADMLLHYGAFPDTPLRDGTPPLLTATLLHHYDLIALLLSKGADPGKPDFNGFTPLMAAAAANDTLAGSMLLEAGANPADTTPAGWNALAYAMSQGSTEMAAILTPPRQNPLPGELRKLILHNQGKFRPGAIKSLGLNTGLKPLAGWMTMGWSLRFTGKDLMYSYNAGIMELRYNTLVSTGFSNRRRTAMVTVPGTGDTLLYQMQGRRNMVFLELDKHFRIAGTPKRWFSLSAGITPFYAWGRFRGSEKRPWQGFGTGVFAGIRFETSILSLYSRYGYLPLHDAPVPDWSFETGLTLSFRGNRYQLKNKPIPYEFSL
ncbi:MAG TPA: ankyrin repeat domain-containing protein [Bacteroidales bacterium]|nr:ankyrin repeat domain-containing protein [Bacteroidales bacterium]HRZ49626.1 ankyrin repeat domain-containing protein [Bacteroidales bacterium]